MTAITIREVPDPILDTLKLKAARAGKSLQGYLLDLVTREAATPSLAEMMTRLDRETRTEISTADILSAIDEGRERR
ncbi:antitoxin [Kitasatospora sp. NPDC057512]|uniref:FitA-like ribbon-helix-helix domain-containing protein n=1 Tax=Kitasatospora sp. NPDC057512 TaxID=3346154 RepID=UPI0036903F10